MNRRFACLLILVCVLAAAAAGAGAGAAQDEQGGEPAGISERLGQTVPLDITFRDETGREVALKDIIDRPVIMLPAYYTCTRVCVDMLAGLADVLGRTDALPGRDYKVITVSFDDKDTARGAAQKKRDYVMAASTGSGKGAFAPDAWTFLTGDAGSIKRLAGAIGFNYRSAGQGFDHSSALIVLSPGGRIIRYMYGPTHLPKELEMALVEARRDRAVASIPGIIALCFRTGPKGRPYVVDILKVSALAISAMVAGFFIYLATGGRKGL